MIAAAPKLPTLSAVIPTHDTRRLTLRCLETLETERQSEGSELEVIVVDDGSRDRTARAVRERFPEVLLLENHEAQGFTSAANRGLAFARGEILLLLNSDTEVCSGTLEALSRAFAEDPGLGVAGGRLYYPDGRPQWSGGRAPGLLWLFVLASGLAGLAARLPGYRRLRPLEFSVPFQLDWVTGAALALRREVWEEVGPMDEAFHFYAQDLDLCLRARHKGWKVKVLPSVQILHHHGETIRREAGAEARQHPEFLWIDLLQWARKSRGPLWALFAWGALLWGGGLRIVGRWLLTPFVASETRAAFRHGTRAFEGAWSEILKRPPANRGW